MTNVMKENLEREGGPLRIKPEKAQRIVGRDSSVYGGDPAKNAAVGQILRDILSISEIDVEDLTYIYQKSKDTCGKSYRTCECIGCRVLRTLILFIKMAGYDVTESRGPEVVGNKPRIRVQPPKELIEMTSRATPEDWWDKLDVYTVICDLFYYSDKPPY